MSDTTPLSRGAYAKNAILFYLCALAPTFLSAAALWSFIASPDTHGWRLLALRAVATFCLIASLIVARATARAWRQGNGWLLRKGYGFITENPIFWARLLSLPPEHFEIHPEEPSDAPPEDKLWTELVEEEALLAAQRRPDASAIPIKPKRSAASKP